MKPKRLVRWRGDDGEGGVLGLLYTQPRLVPRKEGEDFMPGRVVVGGPIRFEEQAVDILGHFNFSGTQVQVFDGRHFKHWWAILDVQGQEWLAGLVTLRQAGYSLETVNYLGRFKNFINCLRMLIEEKKK